MKTFLLFLLTASGLLVFQSPESQTSPQRVGKLPDGGFLLNSGWTIRPAGEQVPVDTLPMSTALSPNGKFLLVLNGGYNPPSISVIEVASRKEVGRTPLPDCWLGLTFAPDSNKVYVGGGSKASVYELTLDQATGALTRSREFANVAAKSANESFIGDVAVSPDAHLLYAADIFNDSLAVINLQSGQVIDHWKTGRRPYRIILSPGGRQLVVSSWADAAVYQHDASSGTMTAKIRVAPHPTDMVWLNQPAAAEQAEGGATFRARIFIAAANTNSVYALGVAQDGSLSMLESINVALTPLHPLGMTPSALAIGKSGNHLYVACSDANAVAVVDISGAHSRVTGFIPTGWYPTAVRSLEGGQLVIVNGKGLGSYPNPQGPNPSLRAAITHEGSSAPPAVQYVAHIQTGTVAFLKVPDEQQLNVFTKTVMQNSPYNDDMLYGPVTDGNQTYFASTEEHPSPIKHVIYIIKENRTYDQVLGDMPKGNGDKSLVLFGEQITPNLHQIANEFILYDNFYENADVSADGHNWASAAIAPDYTVKMWPSEYGHRKKVYDFEGTETANEAPAGRIWDNALQKGLTIRDYGYWSENVPLKSVTPGGRQIQKLNDPVLQNNTDMNYRGWDLDYSDVDRAREFSREWKEFDAKGDAPQFMIVRLGNDHTQGTRAGALTPFAYVAQNDQAVGMYVDTVSHSKLWTSTAIFIIEDDAQNGPDHVDSHRAPAFVISPYTHRGIVDSTMYNQAGLLRTMELILGLRPMTHFDAAGTSMLGTFAHQADTRPYALVSPKTSLTDRNAANAPGVQQSNKMDFSEADLVDDDELNEVLWRAIKHTDLPPPTRSFFTR